MSTLLINSAPVAFLLLSLSCMIGTNPSGKNGIVGFGIPLYDDLCCQACHDSLSSLWLNCTSFDDHSSDMDMSGMDMDGMDMDGMSMGTTSDDCRASNVPWLQTMAYCLQQRCNADGYPADKQAVCFSTYAVGMAMNSTPTFQDSLPAEPPTTELSGSDVWLNVTSLVNGDLYDATHGTYGEFGRQEYLHTEYSVVLILVTLGICIVCGIVNLTAATLPGFGKQLHTSNIWSKLQRHVFLPPLFGGRRLEPLPGNLGYVPGRALSIFIGVYVVLNVVFSAVNIRSFQPNIWFMSAGFELCEYVGNRTGTLSLVNVAIAILFAGRNNLLISITGWSQSTFLTLHRWAARVATLQAVVHSIVYTMAYFQPGYDGASAYAAKAAEPFYYWGIIATIAMCLAMGFAILPLRSMAYELFLGLHIVLVVIALVGCWYHLVPHFGLDYGYQVWLYIAFAFWGGERVTRLFRIAYFNRTLVGGGSSTAVVQAVPGTSNILQLTVFPRVVAGAGPGQHTFVYFPALGRFWESHPFSIASWREQRGPAGARVADSSSSSSSSSISKEKAAAGNNNNAVAEDRASLRFLVRVHSGATAALQRRALAVADGGAFETSAYIEGPYAGHRAALRPLRGADTVVCVIGGIGITHALGFLQEFARERQEQERERRQGPAGYLPTGGRRGRVMGRTRRFVLAWSAREMALIEHVRAHFFVDAEGVEYSLFCTGSGPSSSSSSSADNAPAVSVSQKTEGLTATTAAATTTTTTAAGAVTAGRMDIASVLRSTLEPELQTTVLVCGPGAMADEATREVVKCAKAGFKVDIIEEAYTW